MLDVVFYLQLLFLVVFSAVGVWKRSPAFLMFASILSFSTAVMLASEGVSFKSGWDGTASGSISNLNFSVSSTYTTYTTESSPQVNFWFYALLILGFVWLMGIFVLIVDLKKIGIGV